MDFTGVVFRLSIRQKFLGILGTMILVSMTMLGIFSNHASTAIRAEFQQYGELLAQTLGQQSLLPMLMEDTATLSENVEKAVASGNLVSAALYTASGKKLAGQNEAVLERAQGELLANPDEVVWMEGVDGGLMAAAFDVRDESGEKVGTALIATSTRILEAEEADGTLIGAIALLAFVLIGALAIWTTNYFINRPIETLSLAARRIAEGNFDEDDLSAQQLQDVGKSEILQLENSFREMSAALKAKVNAAKEIAAGNLAVEIPRASEADVLSQAMVEIKSSLEKMSSELNSVIRLQQEGQTDARCWTDGLSGTYAELLLGVNSTLDAVYNPVEEAISILQEYADGNLSRKMRDFPGKQMRFSEGLNGMRNNLDAVIRELLSIAEAAEKGDLKKRGKESLFKGSYQELVRVFNKVVETIMEPVRETADCLQEMAGGNLTVTVSDRFQGDHAVMTHALNTTLVSLNQLLGEVAGAVHQTSNGAHQISQSGKTLSDGASSQAASLEEISASMSDIDQQTRRNEENATIANRLVGTAREVADKGNQHMEQMLVAMGAINESSGEISNIIKTI
ncbi:MAG TPA: methyl-accepting chemotaxis protein, partial [Calditrichia bacterium]|nr:methyl-accepting chemotaxis protein [Calditrichia bacterium]